MASNSAVGAAFGTFAPHLPKGIQTMSPSALPLQIEGQIARAHLAIAIARDLASSLSDLGLHDDLQLILVELERLQVDLLRSGRPRRLRIPLPSVSATEER